MKYDAEHPLRVPRLRAGGQSTCLALMADTGVIEPPPNLAIFADVGWEPPHIYAHLGWLESEQVNPPFQGEQTGRATKHEATP